MSARLLPYGETAILVEFDDPDDVVGFDVALSHAVARGDIVLDDVVPGARTVLVRGAAEVLAGTVAKLATTRTDWAAADVDAGDRRHHEIPVHYDGDDLVHVARALDVDVSTVIAMHHGSLYSVAFCGFAPGFAYLRGLAPALQLPRRETPRSRVRAGSVAIAAEYSAIYPRESPGGWHLLGTTAVSLFEPDRAPPALLAPGDTVRFVDIGSR